MGPKQPSRSDRPSEASGAPAAPAAETLRQSPGDTVTVEATTAEKALEEVTGLLGSDAEIVQAGKVQRGGVGGFFAKEVVQLTARRRSDAPAGSPQDASGVEQAGTPAADQPAGAAQPQAAQGTGGADPFTEALGRFLAEHDGADPAGLNVAGAQAGAPAATRSESGRAARSRARREEATTPAATVGSAVRPFTPAALESIAPSTPSQPELRVEQGPNEIEEVAVAAPHAVAPGTREASGSAGSAGTPGRPATPGAISGSGTGRDAELHVGAPRGTGAPAWSVETLLALGVPVPVVRPLIETTPATDTAWIEAISNAVAPLCGQLSAGPQLFVGPRAHLLAGPLRLPQADYPDSPPATGSAILAVHVPGADLDLVRRLAGDRGLHLVAGGRDWERLESLRPSQVSWVGAEALPAALALCAGYGITLGYGMARAEAAAFHATPLDVALGLRDLVGRR